MWRGRRRYFHAANRKQSALACDLGGCLFGTELLLSEEKLVGIFWDQALRALVSGIPEMWLFGTQIWILFLIVAVRHYLNYRKGGRGRDASGDKAPEHPMEPSEEGETSGSSTKTEEENKP